MPWARFRTFVSRLTWWQAGAVGLPLLGLSAVLGRPFVQLGLMTSCVLSFALVEVGLRRGRPRVYVPWRAVQVMYSLFFVSMLLRLSIPSMAPSASWEPRLPDVIDLFAFGGAVVAVNSMGRIRDRHRDPTNVIDALILTFGVSALAWVMVFFPYITNASLSLSGRCLQALNWAAGLWTTFGAARMALGVGKRTNAMKPLVGAGVCGMLTQAIAMNGAGIEGTLPQFVGAMAMFATALAALHPEMGDVTERSDHGVSRMTARRLAMMTVAIVAAPAILLVKTLQTGIDVDLFIGLIVAWLAVVCLVMTRMFGLVRARERLAEELERMALHDPLTQLPNRRVWTDRTGSQIGRQQTRCAVLLVDVNDFKIVNDSYGHEVGDTLLAEVARRLNTCVREGDLVARLGGDEFAILLPDIASQKDANDVEDRIRQAFDVPFQRGSVQLRVTVSVGIAFDEAGMTADGVLHHADIAMYEHKRTKSQGF